MNTETFRNPDDYMVTVSGKRIYPLNPRVDEIDVKDMIHALSHMCRYGGHSFIFWSVAQHSIMVAKYLADRGASTLIQFYGLWHDGTEGYLVDLPRPIKRHLEKYRAIEDRLHKVIWEALGVREPTEEEWAIIKKADNAVLSYEASILQSKDDWWKPNYQPLGYSMQEVLPVWVRKGFFAEHERLLALLKKEAVQ